MTRIEHYRQAEALLEHAADTDAYTTQEREVIIAEAQVHATLANVPVTMSVRDA